MDGLDCCGWLPWGPAETGRFLASKNLEIGSPEEDDIGGVCLGCVVPPVSDEIARELGGDIGSNRKLPGGKGLLFCDFGDGD